MNNLKKIIPIDKVSKEELMTNLKQIATNPKSKTALTCILGGAGGAVVGMSVLPLIGFGSIGVSAGSVAAGIQSSIGSVAAGGVFATMQSLGATGIGSYILGGAGGVAGYLVASKSNGIYNFVLSYTKTNGNNLQSIFTNQLHKYNTYGSTKKEN